MGKQRTTRIKLYVWGGRRFGVRARGYCVECEMTEQMLTKLLQTELQGLPVELQVKPWLTHLFEALRQGAWKTPALLINGQLLSQGTVPERGWLLRQIRERLGTERKLQTLLAAK
ncbi:MAG: thioredoxin family protein [Acidobacteriota bacterium]